MIAYDDGRWSAWRLADGTRIGAHSEQELVDLAHGYPRPVGKGVVSEQRPPLLRRPLLWTIARQRAASSRFMWAPHGEPPHRWSLSLLGVINGLLPRGWLLVHMTDGGEDR